MSIQATLVASSAQLDQPAPLRKVPPSALFVSLAPVIAALVALLLHRFLPSRQTTIPMAGIYPMLLRIAIGFSIFACLLQLVVTPIRPWLKHYMPLLAAGICVICAWDLITLKLAWMPLPYFPGPDQVFRSLVDERAALFANAWSSFLLLMTGYLIGAAAGLFSGLAIGWSSAVRYWGMPVMKLIGPLPATALIPLAMALFTSSFFSGAALIALAVWFPLTMLTATGVSNVRVSYLDVARTLGASRFYLIFRVAIPAAMPNIFVGLFMGLGAAFLTLIAAETVGVSAGLGYYLRWRQAYAEYDRVYAALLVMAVFFSLVMTLLFKLRDRVLVWQKGVIKW